MALTDEQCQEAVDALKSAGGIKSDAARLLGLNRRTYADRIETAARRGMMSTEPVMPGFEITKTSAVLDEDGNVQKQYVTQQPERKPGEAVPDGHAVKGVSTYIDGQGRIRGQWLKTATDKPDPALIADALIKKWTAVDFEAPEIPAPKQTESDLLTLYPLADWHLGMLAQGDETSENWDLKIAQKALSSTMAEIFASTPNSEIGIVLGTGDFVHADNKEGVTDRNKHPLDVDGRYQKVVESAQEMAYDMVCLALQKHQHVVVRFLPGNHDEYSAIHITGFLRGIFRDNPRVTVDNNPSLYFVHPHGKTLLVATHGHTIKPQGLQDFVTSAYREQWGKSQHVYGFIGHFHHKEKLARDHAGMVVEILPAPIPPDAYTYGAGYMSGRAMTGITYHKEHGEISRDTRTLRKQ